MVYQPADADVILSDFGVDVLVAGASSTVLGILEHWQAGATLPGGLVADADRWLLKTKPGALGAIVPDTQVTVDGAAYRWIGAWEHGPSVFQWHRLSPVTA